MYFVVMPRVSLIVILVMYVRYLYSVNFPTVICLPSMLLFILWRDTTSEVWTPVQFPLHSFTILLLLTLFTLLAYYYPFTTRYAQSLFTANRWDWQPHRKLGAKFLVVLCRFHVPAGGRYTDKQFIWHPCPECREASKHHLLKFVFLLLVRFNLGFTTEGRLATVLIIPSSWGSQRAVTTSHQAVFCKVKYSALFHLAQPFSKRYTRYNVLIARYIKN
jgi:hypothetical protein